jgi:two-component system chemotaxis sensor kinase CheA
VIQQQFVTKDLSRLEESIRQMIKLSKEIQTISMSLRLLPVKPTLQKLQRAVRDTAQILGKEVKFDIVGEEMEVDKSVIDRLADPLIHIVRNAVDHGLETPEVRKQSGKAEQGNVKLALFNEGSNLVIEVKDDGRGIDTEVIKKKAIEKNLISQSQAYSEKQLINLIFHPGFSTKTETSEISGRGVGMDVVKTNVEQVGGSVDVKSTVGSGSLFRIQIPQSLAVIEGVVVTCGSNRYVVPMSQVQETINIKSQKVYKDKLGLGSCFELRGTVVPLYYLQDLLFKKTSDAKSSGTALLFNIEEHLVAIEVDDVLRAQQIVIKPFSNGIAPQKGWAGACVLGDGLPTLIVDPADLLNGYLKHQNQVGLTSKVS